MITQQRTFLLVGLGLMISTIAEAQITRSATGPDAAAIQSTVDQFRSDLGTLNPNTAGSLGTGRREVNWDGVPDSFSAPNNLPANFFNSNSPRGVVFSTPGTGFQVSANANANVGAGGSPIEFGNINASYPSLFAPFSSQRLFTAVGSNIVDVLFFVPGSSTPALSRGFGAVFSDVDLENTTSLQFFNASNSSLGTFFVGNTVGNETFSFLGASFADPIISRVRITNGNQILAAGNTLEDLVVMDDFIFGEPVAIPEPTSLWLLLASGCALCVRRVRN